MKGSSIWLALLRFFRYLWASPNTLLGLIIGGLGLCTGGWVCRQQGVLEFYGGFSKLWLYLSRAYAMTLGHVILGRDQRCLDYCRRHEFVHVQQAEILGPFFIPAYLSASLWALLRGRHYYRDNWFERDAERRCQQE